MSIKLGFSVWVATGLMQCLMICLWFLQHFFQDQSPSGGSQRFCNTCNFEVPSTGKLWVTNKESMNSDLKVLHCLVQSTPLPCEKQSSCCVLNNAHHNKSRIHNKSKIMKHNTFQSRASHHDMQFFMWHQTWIRQTANLDEEKPCKNPFHGFPVSSHSDSHSPWSRFAPMLKEVWQAAAIFLLEGCSLMQCNWKNLDSVTCCKTFCVNEQNGIKLMSSMSELFVWNLAWIKFCRAGSELSEQKGWDVCLQQCGMQLTC